MKDSREVSNIEWDFCERIYAPKADPQSALDNDGAGTSSAIKKEDLKVCVSLIHYCLERVSSLIWYFYGFHTECETKAAFFCV